MNNPFAVRRVVGVTAFLAGVLWILIWVASGLAWPEHEAKTTILTLSYEDYNRLLVLPLLLLLLSWVGFFARHVRHSRVLGWFGFVMVFLGFGLLITGQVLQFWLAGWGSTEDFSSPLTEAGWGLFLLGLLLVLLGQVLCGILILRRQIFAHWTGWFLILGSVITLVYAMGPAVQFAQLPILGLWSLIGTLWAVSGYVFWSNAARKPWDRKSGGSREDANSPGAVTQRGH